MNSISFGRIYLVFSNLAISLNRDFRSWYLVSKEILPVCVLIGGKTVKNQMALCIKGPFIRQGGYKLCMKLKFFMFTLRLQASPYEFKPLNQQNPHVQNKDKRINGSFGKTNIHLKPTQSFLYLQTSSCHFPFRHTFFKFSLSNSTVLYWLRFELKIVACFMQLSRNFSTWK